MVKGQVLLLPGAVLPAELAYRSLIEALGPDVDARTKDLEVYASEHPASDFSLANEVDGLLRMADKAGFETFHAVGYSAGGAAVLATVAAAPERLRSLTLLEPAWAGWAGISEAESTMWERIRDVMQLPDDEMMGAFVQAELAPGVAVPEPPPGPPPDWMSRRPAGLRALVRAFEVTDIDPASLRSFDRPVYFALGGLSHPDLYAQIADRLEDVFPDFSLEVFDDRHHFDPPHRVEPERLAGSLQSVWSRADGRFT